MKKRFHSLALAMSIIVLMLIACSKEDAISPIKTVLPSPPIIPPTAPPTPVPTTPPIGHKAPIANAGSDTSLYVPFHNHTLNGRTSTGIIVSYKWNLVKGPSEVGIGYSGYNERPEAFVNGLIKVGIYEFELTVTDYYNLSSKDTMKITVAEPKCTITNKEVIIKDLKWGYPWLMETQIYDLFSYIPANSYIKNFYIKRDASDQWELIEPWSFHNYSETTKHLWEYSMYAGVGTIHIYPGSNTTEDTPDVKIEYCN